MHEKVKNVPVATFYIGIIFAFKLYFYFMNHFDTLMSKTELSCHMSLILITYIVF